MQEKIPHLFSYREQQFEMAIMHDKVLLNTCNHYKVDILTT